MGWSEEEVRQTIKLQLKGTGLEVVEAEDGKRGIEVLDAENALTVDAILRRRAKEEGRSLNEVALEALRRGLGLAATPIQQRDLTDVAGAWEAVRATDAVLAEQRRIDPDLWQ